MPSGPRNEVKMQGACSLGVVAVLLGLLLAAWHANEWLKFLIVAQPPYTIETMPEADCDDDELEEEGLSEAECQHLVYAVQDINISSPAWFKRFHIRLSAIGTALALLSVFAGIALVDLRPWAGTLSVFSFAALALLDLASFAAVINTGPLVRQMYLWVILLWFFFHLTMTLGAIVQRQSSSGTVTNG